MQADDYFYMQGIERKAASAVWKKFGINRFELNMLASLSAFLCLRGRKIISRKIFTEWLGLGYKEERKCWMYIGHLVRKGGVHRLAYRRPDGNCLAISPFGMRVLEEYERILSGLEEKRQGTYKGLAVDLTNLPDGYTLKQAGRD